MQLAGLACAKPRLRQQRDRVRDEVRGDERHHTDHREAAVLQLGRALAGKRLRRQTLGETKRIPQQRDLARRATHHVVRLDRRLTQPLEDADDADDLELASIRHSIPRRVAIRAAQAGESDALLDGQVAREQRATRRNPRPAGDGSHGDARVLQLSRAVPGEGLLRGNLGEANGVEHLAARLRASALHVGDAHLQGGSTLHGRRRDDGRRDERSRGGNERQHGSA
mmetsp:Transcript_55856/g.153598  ORF Transcript_55856/g.153598 Transcript_55856/m.153598 type:complete len:225 (-) Transcript_55856:27-701(-)